MNEYVFEGRLRFLLYAKCLVCVDYFLKVPLFIGDNGVNFIIGYLSIISKCFPQSVKRWKVGLAEKRNYVLKSDFKVEVIS